MTDVSVSVAEVELSVTDDDDAVADAGLRSCCSSLFLRLDRRLLLRALFFTGVCLS